MKDRAAVEQLLKQVAAWGCTDAQRCAATWLWIGAFNENAGNLGAAVTAYEKAAERNPGDAATWVKLADASSRLGAHARAVHAYERAAARKPGDAAIAERLQQERQKVIGASGAL